MGRLLYSGLDCARNDFIAFADRMPIEYDIWPWGTYAIGPDTRRLMDKLSAWNPSLQQSRLPSSRQQILGRSIVIMLLTGLLLGCGSLRRESPTRTPVPTYTPTPVTNQDSAALTAENGQVADAQPPTPEPPTPVPPTAAPTVTPTPQPTATPTVTSPPTNTPAPTNTPLPTATPDYAFELETAEKFPTESLAPNVVRIHAYIYSSREYGLGGYSLRITHNGARLPSDELSIAGIPEQTRAEPSAYTRFSNLNMIFVEAQAGTWTIDLIDPEGNIVGPQAQFQLSNDENTRELYVRYRRIES